MNRQLGIGAGVVALVSFIAYGLGKTRGKKEQKQRHTREEIFVPIRKGSLPNFVQMVGDRIVFYVDVGDVPPREALEQLTRFRAEQRGFR